MNIVSEQEKEILEETTAEEKVSEEVVEESVETEVKEEENASGEEAAKDKKILGKKKKTDKKTEAYEAKIAELDDRVKRQMAEFENFRKRTEKEKAAMFEMGAKSVVEKILPVVDNFEVIEEAKAAQRIPLAN